MKQDKHNSKYVDDNKRLTTTSFHGIQMTIGRYLFVRQFSKDKIVLDIACGKGVASSYLKRDAKMVIGGDISKPNIRYTAAHYQKDGLYFLRLDAQQLPFANSSFDLIVSLETIEHLPQYEQFLTECHRVLKEDGVFICSTPNKAIVSPNSKVASVPYHFKEFYPWEYHRLFKQHFPEVTLYGQFFPSKVKKFYMELRALILPVLNILPFMFRVRKVLEILNSLYSRSSCQMKWEDINENDFTKMFNEKYRVFQIQESSPSTWTIIGVAKK